MYGKKFSRKEVIDQPMVGHLVKIYLAADTIFINVSMNY